MFSGKLFDFTSVQGGRSMFESLRDSRPAYSHGLWVSITISQFHGVMYRFLKARECSNFQRSQFVLFCLCLGPPNSLGTFRLP